MNKVRVRLAPSPTGFLHIGTLRTYLYDYLFARQNKGEVIIRVEDTDQKREVVGAVESLQKTLQWSGLEYDEGLEKDGKFGPYTQSQRLDLYNKYVQVLIDKGSAYYAFDTAEELEAMRQKQVEEKRAPMYDRESMRNQFTLGQDETQKLLDAKTPHVVRLVVPENKNIVFTDLVRGDVRFNTSTVDDQILMKSDGFPTYHLAVVVDDHLMEITHVFRGEEWLSSTPKHILLYEAFGWNPPQYAHLPLLLNTDKTKLSKRKGDVSVEGYIQKGYLREAILNFVALLGWNPKTEQEFLSVTEMLEKFDVNNVHKAGAVVDMERLNWFNAHYIKQMAPQRYLEYAKGFVQKPEGIEDWQFDAALYIQKERLSAFSELPNLLQDLFTFEPTYDSKNIIWKKSQKDETVSVLEEAVKLLQNYEEVQVDLNDSYQQVLEEQMGGIFKKKVSELGLPNGNFFWPIRYALSGKDRSPNYFLLIWLLGREESIRRLELAKKKLVEE